MELMSRSHHRHTSLLGGAPAGAMDSEIPSWLSSGGRQQRTAAERRPREGKEHGTGYRGRGAKNSASFANAFRLRRSATNPGNIVPESGRTFPGHLLSGMGPFKEKNQRRSLAGASGARGASPPRSTNTTPGNCN